MKLLGVCLAIWLGFTISAFAATPEEKPENAVPPAEEPAKALLINLDGDEPPESVSPVLTVGGRVDVGFSAGSPVTQGFSISSMRLNAMGSVGRFVDYGLAFGQTREFSSALLPQLLPVEAFIAVKAGATEDVPYIRAKGGMFNPSLNPWWTPDLAEVNLPDFHSVHRLMLLDNDLGAEVTFYPIPERLEVSVGAFNGNGIFSLNTNNSKAFTGMIKGTVPLGDGLLQAGFGGYFSDQSAPGSVNFRSNRAFNFFSSVQLSFFTVGFDYLFGRFEDISRISEPSATAGFVLVALRPGFKAFARAESIDASPSANGGHMNLFQVGPLIEIDEAFRAFLYYERIYEKGSAITSGQVRVRLAI